MLIQGEDCSKYLTKETLHILHEIKGVERLKKIYKKAEHNNPPTAVDIIIEYHDPDFKGIVLIERRDDPFKGCWALPGGFQEYGDTLERTAMKETDEETGLSITLLTQLKVYSEKDRDPRGHVNSIGFVARGTGDLKAGDDATKVKVFPLEKLPKLAFDHKKRIEEYLAWRAKNENS
ncbi:NUDIX hydrolase [Candidatus Woesearchaeota archaeon]|nr:NUDIX hydrolase [Candidatus Woesearchaeota archaeon]